MATEAGQVSLVQALLQSGRVDVNGVINVSHSMRKSHLLLESLPLSLYDSSLNQFEVSYST